MFRPTIAPRRITKSASVGLFSAARNSVRNVQRATNRISSSAVSKPQKFSMNFIEFFGSKKNSKILQKSLKTIRDSMVATFGIAKSLKKAVGKGAGGIFGFIGKVVGGLKGAAGIFKLLMSPFLKVILGVVAVGGIGALLFAFKDQILGFIQDKASGVATFIRNVAESIIIDNFQSQEYKKIAKESDQRIEEFSGGGEDVQENRIAATNAEIATLKDQLETLNKKRFKNNSDLRTIDAIKSRINLLETGQMEFPKRRLFGIPGSRLRVPEFFNNPVLRNVLPFAGFFAGRSLSDLDPRNFLRSQAENQVAQEGIYTGEDYTSLNPQEKLTAIQQSLSEFASQNDIENAKLYYQRDLKRNISESNKRQAQDTIKYLDKVKGNALGGIEGDDKTNFLKELSSLPNLKGKKVSQRVQSLNGATDTTSGGAGGGGTQVGMLPMGNQNNGELVRNDSSGNPSGGSSMVVHSNVDHDNFSYLFNKVDFNIV